MSEKFFILGYYGWNNTGDDAMLYALLQELHVSHLDSEFVVLSRISVLIPPSIKNSVRFVSNKTPLRVLWKIMQSSIFIMGGGTHLYDYGNKKNRIIRLTQMLMILIFARVFCRIVCFLGIGVESPSTTWGKFLIRQICRLTDFMSVRDSLSYNILKELGLEARVAQSFDLAARLEFPPTLEEAPVNRGVKILGVSILPFFEIYYGNKGKDLLFLHKIAEGLNQWLKQDHQSLIYLFIFKGESKDDDVLITEILRKQLESSERVKFVPYNPNPIETMNKVAQCHAFIGMRYHSCVFAYLTNTPLLIINYFQKCQALAEDIGLSKHAVISLEEILNGQFGTYLKNLQEHPDDFVATLPVDIAKQMAKNGLAIDRRFQNAD